ncbi:MULTISPECIES: hypothetical protein [Exiguobacterium]|uniref:hypothetical protein n=1 Tax=Exiguobacterium sp. UBA1053 TaxID=1946487 RepID=UPI0025C3D347|nr:MULTISPECIES: hypothetical protein [Exiguobacterium]
MVNPGNVNPRKSVVPLATGSTKDSVTCSLLPDLIITSLAPAQSQEFSTEISKQDAYYLEDNSIGVTMSVAQHTLVSDLIKLLLSSLDSSNNFRSDKCEINLTKHFLERLELRSNDFDDFSPTGYNKIRKYITEFDKVSIKFRWNPKGITYVLTSNTHQNDSVVISLRRHRGVHVRITVNAVTYY